MQLFSNNFKTTLAAAVDNVTTSITVVSSAGLPTLGVSDTVLVTLESTNRLVVEIVEVTAVVGNVLTVVRAQEGTVASAFDAGSFVEGRLTAGWLNDTGTKLGTIETGAQVNTVTPTNIATLTDKTIDDISNNVGANRVHYKVKNMTGSTLANGTVVKVAGYEAGEETIRVTPTTSTNDVAIGIIHGSIAKGEVGLVVNTGVATGINTTSYTAGDVLYQNGSGGLTHTKPTTGTYQAVAVPLNAKVNGALLVEFTEPNPVDWDSRYYTETEVNNLLSGKQNTITGAASSVVTSNLNANVVVTTDASGKLTSAAISTTELSYLDGVSSNIQTQLGGKQATITGAATTITSSNLTASMALVSDASGKVAAHGTVSAAELGYLDGVTSGIQGQLDNKASSTHTHAVSDVTGLQTALDSKANTSSLATVATSGSYTDLTNKPKRYLNAILSDSATAITNATNYITPVELPVSGTITSIRARTATGTCSVQFKRNGVALGTAISATTSGVSQAVSQAVVAGDLITVDTSSAGGNGLTISVEIN